MAKLFQEPQTIPIIRVNKLGYCTVAQKSQKCASCNFEKNFLHQPFKYSELLVCALCFDRVQKLGINGIKNQ